MEYTPWSISLDGMQFSGKRWGDPTGIPVLALHGWLDNCASFDLLAPKLQGVDVYCVDVAGHGKTDARPGGGPYSIWQDVTDVFALLDAMGFERAGLLGHSRGAMIATLAAGTFPERILGLGLIEGIVPLITKDTDAPKQLRQSIVEKKIYRARNRSVYPSYEKAVVARENGLFKLNHGDANILATWGVEAVESGYSWGYDPEVMMASSARLTDAQVNAFLTGITAPTRLVLSESNGVYSGDPELVSRIQTLNIECHFLPGGHHLHMSEQYQAVADFLQPLFAV